MRGGSERSRIKFKKSVIRFREVSVCNAGVESCVNLTRCYSE